MMLLDSDHLSVLLEPRDTRRHDLLVRLRAAPDVVAIPVVVEEEQLRGWLAQIRPVHDVHRQVAPYLRLAKTLDFLQEWDVIDWSQLAADQFKLLRTNRVRIGSQDLKIACTALVNEALLLSANLRDFEQVPGLRVQDWLD